MYAIKSISKYGTACIKEEVNGYEISIAFDDSCGTQPELTRADIIVTRGDYDVTDTVVKDLYHPKPYQSVVIVGDIENLIRVYNWCKRH